MRLLLLIATLSVVFAAEAELKPEAKAKEEPKADESVQSRHNIGHSFSDGLELMRHREAGLINDRFNDRDDRHSPIHDSPPGPVILRTPGPLPHDGHPDIQAQNKIIADVFSPDYYQPTWVLDYRYLKTGGRDYTRGPGGQILILPKGVRSKEPKEFPDYDAYLEHLRLTRLSERQRQSHRYGGHSDREHSHYGDNRDDRRHGYDREHHDYDYERDEVRGQHGQSMWHRYG